jgi:hypothetical protein
MSCEVTAACRPRLTEEARFMNAVTFRAISVIWFATPRF